MPARPCTQRAPVRSIRLHCPCMYGFCRLSRMSVLFCAPLRISCTFMHFFAHPCAVRTLTYAALSPHVRLLYALAHIGIVLRALAHILYVYALLCAPLRGFVRLHMSAFSLHHARSSTLSCTSAFFLLPCTCLRALHIFAHIGTLLRKHACVCTPLMPAYFAYILHAFARPLHRIVCSRHDGHGIS